VSVPRYVAVTLDGTLLHGGREYVSRDAARRAGLRAGVCVTETRPSGERLPLVNDAAGWDAYRLRHGVAS
jgi:hypothetical protein